MDNNCDPNCQNANDKNGESNANDENKKMKRFARTGFTPTRFPFRSNYFECHKHVKHNVGNE